MIHAERIDGEWEIRSDSSGRCIGKGHTLGQAQDNAILALTAEIAAVGDLGDDGDLTISTTIHTGTARASRHVGA
jgi:hypothetical protein